MIHALVISIDGAESNGLELLSQAARDADLAVTAVGTTWDTSGSSAALSAVSHSGQVWVQTPEYSDDGLYALEATPAFIVRSSFYGTFGVRPDVVLVGVHEGRNTGQAILHSGTVGAALTGTARGCPSLAISADAGAYEETVAHIAHLAVNWLLQLRKPCTLNVNIPDCPLEELRGIRHTTLDPGGRVRAAVTEAGEDLQSLTLRESPGAADPYTDEGAVDRGFVSVTAIQPPAEDPSVDVDELLALTS